MKQLMIIIAENNVMLQQNVIERGGETDKKIEVLNIHLIKRMADKIDLFNRCFFKAECLQ